MGIISRFADIMKSNMNALLDKCEDPGKMVDQNLRDLREDLAQVKKETAGVMADAKNANMTKTEYLNHLIVYAEKPISTHKKAATYLCRLVNSIQQLTIEPERKEALLEEVRPLWQIL